MDKIGKLLSYEGIIYIMQQGRINLGPYAAMWIKVDPGSTSLGPSKLLIKSV